MVKDGDTVYWTLIWPDEDGNPVAEFERGTLLGRDEHGAWVTLPRGTVVPVVESLSPSLYHAKEEAIRQRKDEITAIEIAYKEILEAASTEE